MSPQDKVNYLKGDATKNPFHSFILQETVSRHLGLILSFPRGNKNIRSTLRQVPKRLPCCVLRRCSSAPSMHLVSVHTSNVGAVNQQKKWMEKGAQGNDVLGSVMPATDCPLWTTVEVA